MANSKKIAQPQHNFCTFFSLTVYKLQSNDENRSYSPVKFSHYYSNKFIIQKLSSNVCMSLQLSQVVVNGSPFHTKLLFNRFRNNSWVPSARRLQCKMTHLRLSPSQETHNQFLAIYLQFGRYYHQKHSVNLLKWWHKTTRKRVIITVFGIIWNTWTRWKISTSGNRNK